jgi:hypothetical protein
MKFFYFVVFVFLAVSAIPATAQSFVDTTRIWSIYNINDTGASERKIIELRGDTAINSIHYTKFTAIQDSGNMNTWMPIGAREDVPAKKVFFYNNGTEYLAYDFSLNDNDTFRTSINGCMVEMIVDTVAYEPLIGGELRKHIYFPNDAWIDGIGSKYGPAYPAFILCPFDFIPELICALEHDTVKYHASAYEDCFYNFIGIEEAALQPAFSIYPNPAHPASMITVACPNQNGEAKITLYDLTGRTVFVCDLPPGSNTRKLMLPVLDNGLYTVRMTINGAKAQAKLVLN